MQSPLFNPLILIPPKNCAKYFEMNFNPNNPMNWALLSIYFEDRKTESQKGYVSWPRSKCSSYGAKIQRSILHIFGGTRVVDSATAAPSAGRHWGHPASPEQLCFSLSEQRRNVWDSGEGLKPLPVTWAPSIFCSVLDTLSDISCSGRCSEQSSLKKNESWQTLDLLLAHTPVHRWLEFSNQITWQAISLSCSGTLSEPWDSHIYITH